MIYKILYKLHKRRMQYKVFLYCILFYLYLFIYYYIISHFFVISYTHVECNIKPIRWICQDKAKATKVYAKMYAKRLD